MYEDSGYYDPPHDPDLVQLPPSLSLEDSIHFDIDDHFHDIDIPEEVMDMPPSSGQVQYNHAAAYGPAPDLLNLLHLPQCGVGSSFPAPPANGTGIWNEDGSVLYDPLLHLGYHSLPQNYGLFCGVEEREGGVFQEVMDGRQFDGNVMDYRRGDMKGGEGKGSFVTERQRRQQLNGKYAALRSLIANPTKNDRASVVGDAIDYIKELLRTVDELKLVVQKKKHGTQRRLKSEDEAAAADVESSSIRPQGEDRDQPLNGALRSSWLQRRSKESFVDVRIIDDEVNIKLNQKRKPNCLLYIVKVLEELQLDLVHVSGGNIGDSYIFMLNTKICEGSSLYAGAIAKRLLEVMDRQYPGVAFPANH